MLRTLKDLFDSFTAPVAQTLPAEREHTVQLAGLLHVTHGEYIAAKLHARAAASA